MTIGDEMTGITPGEWHYIGDEDGDFIVYAGEEFVCNVGNSPIQLVMENSKAEMIAFDITRANARAIAAIPELIEACKEALKTAQETYSGREVPGAKPDGVLIPILKAALLKAGEPE